MHRTDWSGEHKCPPGRNAILFAWALAVIACAMAAYMVLSSLATYC